MSSFLLSSKLDSLSDIYVTFHNKIGVRHTKKKSQTKIFYETAVKPSPWCHGLKVKMQLYYNF